MVDFITNDTGSISIFFKLQFNEFLLQNLLDEIEEFELIGERDQPKVGNIALGPVLLNLGMLLVEDEEYKFSYNLERYHLRIDGNIDYLDKVWKNE